jgi:hypothetical protein
LPIEFGLQRALIAGPVPAVAAVAFNQVFRSKTFLVLLKEEVYQIDLNKSTLKHVTSPKTGKYTVRMNLVRTGYVYFRLP